MLTEEQKALVLALAARNDLDHLQVFLDAINDRDSFKRGYETQSTRADFAQSQLDNRNRRMQIAVWILDEENIPDLEALSEILWPAEKQALFFDATQWCTVCGTWLNSGKYENTGGHRPDCFAWNEKVSPRPDISQPTTVLPQPDDVFVSWNCVTMGHKWGDVYTDHEGTGLRKCLACGDERIL